MGKREKRMMTKDIQKVSNRSGNKWMRWEVFASEGAKSQAHDNGSGIRLQQAAGTGGGPAGLGRRTARMGRRAVAGGTGAVGGWAA